MRDSTLWFYLKFARKASQECQYVDNNHKFIQTCGLLNTYCSACEICFFCWKYHFYPCGFSWKIQWKWVFLFKQYYLFVALFCYVGPIDSLGFSAFYVLQITKSKCKASYMIIAVWVKIRFYDAKGNSWLWFDLIYCLLKCTQSCWSSE